ncbi:hypothetical protein FRX31_017602 [Thalictrum thalictroides]|uniref:Uncharacterized protein n=1 Tax=Thalictrum thalictroides TaxID=46969 RepID=A0A7J6W6G8_THATH|nr:hypothetical protein FRX31_017602 [Thalictrum thalictroides]
MVATVMPQDEGFLILQHDQQQLQACNEGELALTFYDENYSMPWTQPSMIDASMPASNPDTLDDEYSDIYVEALMLQIDECPETEEGEATYSDIDEEALIFQIDEFLETEEGEATNCAADMSTTESTHHF